MNTSLVRKGLLQVNQYCVEIDQATLEQIIAQDNKVGQPTLAARLGTLKGVSDVSYASATGPYIWYSIQEGQDTDYKRELIEKLISSHRVIVNLSLRSAS